MMDAKQTALFVDVVETAGYDVTAYSGRAMYGATCVGVVLLARETLGVFVANVIEALKEAALNDGMLCENCIRSEVRRLAPVPFPEADACAEAFRDMHTDDMGLDKIVYFPQASYSPPVENEVHP